MKMTPFQIIVISIFAVAALLGLLLFASFKGFNQAKPVGQVTVWGTLPAAAIQPALDDLKRTHAEFNTITYVQRNTATFDTDIADALAAGTGPDLIITTQERLLAESNKLAVIPFSVISERSYRDSYLPINDLYLSSQGFYAIPIAVDPLVLYYNRASLSSAGVSEAPRNWETVVGITPKLTVKGAGNSLAKSAIALGSYENIPNARALISLLFLQAGNAITADTGAGLRSALLSSASAREGVSSTDAAMNFYTQFADPAKIVYTWNRSFTDARQSFIAGDTALYVGFASERTLIAASNPNLDFDIAPVPEPQTATTQVNYGLAYAFAVPKVAKNATGALRAAQALSSLESPLMAMNLGMAPAARNQLTPPANDLYAPVIYPQALIARGWLSPAPESVDRIFAGMINDIISGRASEHDALSTADQALTAVLP
jgi:ABC-type glycerol-3-phosphate transport system substrate-binding protein